MWVGLYPLHVEATEAGSFSFSSEVRRPDMTREARDTAPKFNPTAHVRETTKEEAGNYKKRDMLGSLYSPQGIRKALAAAGPFHPFPEAGDEVYRALPEGERAAVIEAAEALIGYDWPTLTAGLYLHFYETGSNTPFHLAYFKRLKTLETLLYAEILEGEGRFIRDIANGVWAICEQTTWATPAHLNVEVPGAGLPSEERPILALVSAEVATLLATAEYFFAEELDALHPVFRERMRHEVNRQVLQPFLTRTDYWWMAYEKPFTNNWNPWITSNYLFAARMFSRSEEELGSHVLKAVEVLDHFLNVYPDDGGCEEGPVYWDHAGGRLLNCLDLLHEMTDGYIDVYDEELIRMMGDFMWFSHIDGPWYVNFADAHALHKPSPGVLFRYGAAVGSTNLQAFAKRFPVKPYPSSNRYEYVFMRQLPDLFAREAMESFGEAFEPELFVSLDDLETVYIREDGDTGEGFYLAAKGGYNAESHNHNDVGNFIVFLDGEPLLIDTGVGTYTSKTFSEQRYEIWSMQSSYHNLPDINGEAQPHMIQWRSSSFETSHSAEAGKVAIGLETAYPEEANLEAYLRSIKLDRTQEKVILNEHLTFQDGLANAGGNQIDFHLMTHHVPSAGDDPGQIRLAHPETGSIRALLAYPMDLDVLVTEIQLEDPRMAESWGDTLYRITLSTTLPPDELQRDFRFNLSKSSE
jgi:hypothetical protein